MKMLSKAFLFSFEGRINRQPYWMFFVYLIAGALVLALASKAVQELAFVAALWLFVGGLASIAVQVKRWHDRGKSGWWWWIQLIPAIGPLWALIECGFLKGSAGPNEYGPNPLAVTG